MRLCARMIPLSVGAVRQSLEVIVESVPNPTLSIVHEPCRRFWAEDEFGNGFPDGFSADFDA